MPENTKEMKRLDPEKNNSTLIMTKKVTKDVEIEKNNKADATKRLIQ